MPIRQRLCGEPHHRASERKGQAWLELKKRAVRLKTAADSMLAVCAELTGMASLCKRLPDEETKQRLGEVL